MFTVSHRPFLFFLEIFKLLNWGGGGCVSALYIQFNLASFEIISLKLSRHRASLLDTRRNKTVVFVSSKERTNKNPS